MPSLDLGRSVRYLRRQVWSTRELCIYVCDANRIRSLPVSRPCRRDAWDDLLAMDHWSYADQDRETYLETLAKRRGEGRHHLYSLVEDGILIHYGWLTFPQDTAPDAALGLEFIPPAGSAALWDYFTHPAARGRGLYRRTLWQCLHDAVEIDGARQVFIYVYADNVVSRGVIEKAGFLYRGSLVLARRFFRARRFATWAGAPIEVRVLGSGRQAESRQHRGPVPALQYGEKGGTVVRRGDDNPGRDQLEPGAAGQRAR